MLKNELVKLENYLSLYCDHLDNARGRELDSGRYNRKNKIRYMINLAVEECDLEFIGDFGKSMLRHVQKRLATTEWKDGKRRSSNTVRNHICVIKGFYTFLKEHDLIESNLIVDYKTPTRQHAKPRVTPRTERLVELLQDINSKNPITHRNLVAIAIMAELGCRSGAVRQMRVNDFDFEERKVYIGFAREDANERNGLKKFAQCMPISERLCNIINDYIETSWREIRSGKISGNAPTTDKIPDADLLFPSKNGLLISQNSFCDLIKIELKKRGFSGITPHALRKHLVMDLSKRGATPGQIMAVTGHKSLKSLDPYLAEEPHRIRRIQEQFNSFFTASNPLSQMIKETYASHP